MNRSAGLKRAKQKQKPRKKLFLYNFYSLEKKRGDCLRAPVLLSSNSSVKGIRSQKPSIKLNIQFVSLVTIFGFIVGISLGLFLFY